MKQEHKTFYFCESRLRNPDRGFTLIEMAIVLVIIALVAAGLVAGKSMIDNMQLRGIRNEASEYERAIKTFELKYGCLPGDCNKATQFFGSAGGSGMMTDNNCRNPASTNLGATGSCNGDGNGAISTSGGISDGEHYGVWQHLNLAGLIDGAYWLTGYGISYGHRRGINAPASKANSVGMWSLINFSNAASIPGYNLFAGYGGTSLGFGGHYAFMLSQEYFDGSWWYFGAPIFTAPAAYLIDNKFDDGKPFSGVIGASPRSAVTGAWCTTQNIAYDDPTNVYNYTGYWSSWVACMLLFRAL